MNTKNVLLFKDELISSFPHVKFKFNEDLTNFTTIRVQVSGNLAVVNTLNDLKNLVLFCNKNSIHYMPLGIGANMLIGPYSLYIKLNFKSDTDCFDQVIPITKKEQMNQVLDEYTFLASMRLNVLTNMAKRLGLSGWDYWTGIPATLGGAVFMNAGTNLGEMSSVVKSVWILRSSGELEHLTIKKEDYSYRQNHFLNSGDFIVAVTLKHLGIDSQLDQKIDLYLKKRMEGQPLKTNNCGCVFQNVSSSCRAGLCLDIMNVKGLTYKGLKISHVHANFIENQGVGSLKDFYQFVLIIQKELYLQYGRVFPLEVQLPPQLLSL